MVFFEISRNSQENICATVSFLIKLQAVRLPTLINKRFWHKNTFFTEHLWTTASMNIKSNDKTLSYGEIPNKLVFSRGEKVTRNSMLQNLNSGHHSRFVQCQNIMKKNKPSIHVKWNYQERNYDLTLVEQN